VAHQLAERNLRDSDLQVSALALALGYSSESAFNAFKRTMGMAPKRCLTSLRPRIASPG
jgi:AraC-like DNA-binding protein